MHVGFKHFKEELTMHEILSADPRSSSRFGRKILQQSSSGLDSSQGSFIALISVIGVLTIIILVLIIFLSYRFCFREKRTKKQKKTFKPILTYPERPPVRIPISLTPSSTPPFTNRSSQELLSPQREQPHTSTDTLNPSSRHRSSMMDAFLNDLNSQQPATLDAKKLNSFLFIDLHSTSSETFPETQMKHSNNRATLNNTTTSGYHTSLGDDATKTRHSSALPYRSWRHPNRKSSFRSRFLVRERSLSTNLQRLPQLRENHFSSNLRDPSDSSLNSNNLDLMSTDISITTDDYDESHAYHVQQHQTMQTIKEEKLDNDHHHQQIENQFFEVVSTYRGDDSDLPMRLASVNIPNSTGAYVNDSILV